MINQKESSSSKDHFLEFLQKHGNYFKNSITLVDLLKIDQPLIYVNDKFLIKTGYEVCEVLGKNCRFLQGPETSSVTVKIIKEGILQRQMLCEDLINYKKDGSLFYNRLVLLPFKNYFVGLQNEIPKEKFQKFNQKDLISIQDKGLNPLTIIYLSMQNPEVNLQDHLSKLDDVFTRLKNFILNL